MSRSSINQNNEAIKTIKEAIGYYEEAYNLIKEKNQNNIKADEIMSVINGNIKGLEGAIKDIGTINGEIRSELNRLKNNKEEEK